MTYLPWSQKDFLEALANNETHETLAKDGMKVNWTAVADALGIPNLFEMIPVQKYIEGTTVKVGSLGQWPATPTKTWQHTIYPTPGFPQGGDFTPDPYWKYPTQPGTVCQATPDATGDSTAWGSYPPAMKSEGPTGLVTPRVSGVDPDDMPF